MKKILLLIYSCCLTLFVSAQQRVVIGLTGDITLSSSSHHGKNRPASADLAEDWFKDAAPMLQDADLTIGSLHGSLFDAKETKGKKNGQLHSEYMIPTKYGKILKNAGFDVLTVASNHGMDFGEEGRSSTIKTLREAGLSFAGFDDGYEFASIQRCGISIAVCAFGHGKNIPSINDIDKATTLIKRLKQQYDLIIISFHGGASGLSYSRVPFREERVGKQRRGNVYKFAHACIDAGADLVFGHGSQVPRAIEFYKNKLIAYSLGSFCTPGRTNMHKALSYAPLLKVQLTKDGNLLTGKIYSFVQKHLSGPIVDEKNLAVKDIIHLSKLDFPKSTLIIEKEGWMSKEVTKRIVVPTKAGNKIATVLDSNPDDYNPINTLVSYSKRLLGSRYAHGRSGGGAFDCSGLMKAVYAKIGYKLNPSSRAQYTQGRPVSTNSLRPGDLVFWRSSRRGGIGHVGMVIEVTGNKKFKFIHAANTSRGVVIDNYPDKYYFSSRYVGARRILP